MIPGAERHFGDEVRLAQSQTAFRRIRTPTLRSLAALRPSFRGREVPLAYLFLVSLGFVPMRSFAYLVAAIAAVGLAIAIAKYPAEDASTAASQTAPASAVADVAVTNTSATGTTELAVPGMHCQFMCFPRVKEMLEASPDVEMVELAPQQDPSVLDNKVVIVHHSGDFDATSAVAKLEREGFPESAVVQ